MSKIVALLARLLFGFGLLLAGMANPAKVLGFLDLAGHWDPSLALVMLAAIAVALPFFTWARRQDRSLLGGLMQLPQRRDLDARLVGGSLLFGVGWGIAGICPGPALVTFAAGYWQGALFCLAMLAGMGLHAGYEWQRETKRKPV
ncbi:MAG: hypothetical protein CTR55_12140 [Pseudomonas sp.]|uniref:DUF6691 family protein n=1 Tax=Pseudomonas sp. TaxID=306 RepID=UPI000CBA74E9|nr:DUF6691 family protein [Pseudomonas sp.]PJI50059.1 MAG: hypothetical protein CTR55_12140 [Pseudomonas sp.]